MYSVKVYGAGSIGNHLTHACRNMGWNVTVCDVDKDALQRMKNEIYPARYGQWDDNITLKLNEDIKKSDYYDVVIIGTPPESHMSIALSELNSKNHPKLILIEKPLCVPTLEGCQELSDLSEEKNTIVLCGYNHTLTTHTREASNISDLGECKSIHVQWLEHWGGIFKAHPWLAGPKDSYLGYSSRGGGSTYEHSHGIDIWQHFSLTYGSGRINQVTAMMKQVKDNGVDYDETTQLIVSTEKGMTGTIVQDVVTNPPVKCVKIQTEKSNIVWEANKLSGHDSLTVDGKEKLYKKTRPDDFVGEIEHVDDILSGKVDPNNSPISLERGITTMMVAAAGSLSSRIGKKVTIDYSKGYGEQAFVI